MAAPAGAQRVLEEWPRGLTITECRDTEPTPVAWLDANNNKLATRRHRQRGLVADLDPAEGVVVAALADPPEGADRFVAEWSAVAGVDFTAEPQSVTWLDHEGRVLT